MKVNLDKESLVFLLKSIEIPWALIDNEQYSPFISMISGHSDTMVFNNKINALSEEELYELYKLCKEKKS